MNFKGHGTGRKAGRLVGVVRLSDVYFYFDLQCYLCNKLFKN